MLPINEIEKKIGYTFKDKSLLCEAFVHSSYANEKKIRSNEQMEFLGDAVLGLITAEYLYKHYRDKDQGDFTKARAHSVSRTSLIEETLALGLDKYILFGASQANINKNPHSKIYCDLYEAVLCAIYLDGGIKPATKFVMSTVKNELDEYFDDDFVFSAKTTLLEYASKRKLRVEFVHVSKVGPEHNPTFSEMVNVNGREMGRGTGNTIRDAEDRAAQAALKKLQAKEQK